jgi:plastocyanin
MGPRIDRSESVAIPLARKSWNDKELIELALTLLAVIAGSLAAIGAFVGASYDKERVELVRKPALFLSCEPEFRLLDIAEGIKPAPRAALLTGRGARWIHLGSDGHGDTPEPFASCALTNYGQLPLFNMRMRLTLQNTGRRGASKSAGAFLDVPGLSPSATYSFALINGTSGTVAFAFEPALTVTRVDTGTQGAVPLFLSQELIDLEHRSAEPDPRRNTSAKRADSRETPTVHINDFLYGPKLLRARTNEAITFVNDDAEPHTVTGTKSAFDSGPIDSGATWVHRFTRPGTYSYICSFHPYMRGRIVVSSAAQ